LGEKVFTRDYWFLKRRYIDQTEAFYAKHGGKTLIIARFVPIVRTFAPFVAGVGKMVYTSFIGYCVSGGILWVSTLTLAGYFFGSIPMVKNNFEVVVMGIIGISVLPILFEFVKANIPRKPAA
jgi:membrane-associated protein